MRRGDQRKGSSVATKKSSTCLAQVAAHESKFAFKRDYVDFVVSDAMRYAPDLARGVQDTIYILTAMLRATYRPDVSQGYPGGSDAAREKLNRAYGIVCGKRMTTKHLGAVFRFLDTGHLPGEDHVSYSLVMSLTADPDFDSLRLAWGKCGRPKKGTKGYAELLSGMLTREGVVVTSGTLRKARQRHDEGQKK